MADAPYAIFSLTKMTGRESKDLRTAMIAGFETPFRPFVVVLCGVLVGIFLCIFLYKALAAFVIFVPMVTGFAAWWLFQRRSSRGMRLTTWEDMRDTRKAKPTFNQFLLCGVVIGIDDEEPAYLSLNTVPVGDPALYSGRQTADTGDTGDTTPRAPGVAAGAVAPRSTNSEDVWFS